MNREHLEHLLRASSQIADDPDVLVIGSQSILGTIAEELSPFHLNFGYYAQGVSVTTAVLPAGWRDRLVIVETASTAPGRGHLLEPHDCVVSKLVAGREKDYAYAAALLEHGLIAAVVLEERIESLDVAEVVRDRLRAWVAMWRSRN